MSTALVTGGTSGIGAAFARALATRGYSLVLVARDADRLAATAAELEREHRVVVEVLSADLSDRADVDRVAARLEDADRPIDLLVNNAGFGVHARLLDRDTSEFDRALDVMCRAVYVLGGAAARAMRDRGHGAILDVSSTAGFITLGAYSAVKAWVTVYTEGLAVELRGTGVRAMALCPGWVRTEFHERAGIRTGSIPEFLWMDADALVQAALRDLDRGRVVSVPSFRYAAGMLALRHLPRSAVRALSARISGSRSPATAPTERTAA